MKSVMPKGVEHVPFRAACLGRVRVMKSVMPKGVEHITVRCSSLPLVSDEVSDAERR